MATNSLREAPSVFLCYAREDFERVNELYNLLKNVGLHPWLDKFDIEGGQLWEVAIERAIAQCDFFLATFSNLSVKKSGYVQKEYRFAIDSLSRRPSNRIFLIPVRLDSCEMPELRGLGTRLSDLQWIDLFQKGPLAARDVEPILRSIEAQSDWRRPNLEVLEVKRKYEKRIDESIIETLRIRELPFTNRILELRTRVMPSQLKTFGKEAYDQYLSSNEQKADFNSSLESFYLIAAFLYRAIIDNKTEVFRHKPFIYPIHQFLSQMIRTAEQDDRQIILNTLRHWLRSKDIYETTRDFAAFELGMSKADDAVGELLAAVEDHFELMMVRYYAAMALGMIKNPTSVDPLLKVFGREKNPQMRSVLAHVILHISSVLP